VLDKASLGARAATDFLADFHRKLSEHTFLMRPKAPKWFRSASTCGTHSSSEVVAESGLGQLLGSSCAIQSHSYRSTEAYHTMLSSRDFCFCSNAVAVCGLQKLLLTSSLHMPRGMPTAYTRFRCTTRTCCNHAAASSGKRIRTVGTHKTGEQKQSYRPISFASCNQRWAIKGAQ
jgi:hypothetical protein